MLHPLGSTTMERGFSERDLYAEVVCQVSQTETMKRTEIRTANNLCCVKLFGSR